MDLGYKIESTGDQIKCASSNCRLCSSKNADVPIFFDKNELKTYKGPPLVCKIISSLNIQVKKNDGLPDHICFDCLSKVESTYGFLRLCEMSDSFLRQYLDFGLHISWILQYSELFQLINHSEDALAHEDEV